MTTATAIPEQERAPVDDQRSGKHLSETVHCDVDLKEGVGGFIDGRKGVIGWILTPFEAFWVVATNGGLHRHDDNGEHGVEGEDQAYAVEDDTYAMAFEARLFTPAAEWRWAFNQRLKEGRAVTLTDTDAVAARKHKGTCPVHATFASPPRLLWGRVAQVEHGWCQLADGRVGSFWVPYVEASETPLKEGDHLELRVVEYLHVEPAHHNVSVVDERFTRLAPAPVGTAQIGDKLNA
jgi:CRISPR-associated protein (TIGR03984 family)